MNSKAIKRQLLAAIAMVLVAAIALGSSTYAWFASNTHVDATGMSVKATTTTTLAICETENGSYGTTMALASLAGDAVMEPCTALKSAFAAAATGDNIGTQATTASVTTVDFAKITKDNKVTNPDSYEATTSIADYLADKTTNADKFGKATEGTDYITDEMYLKYTSEADATVTTKIVITGEQKSIDPALHIALLVDGTWHNYDGCTTANYKNDADGAGNEGYVIDATDISLTQNQAKKVVIYAWYEGEDTDCKTTNAIKVNGLSITCNFDIKAGT